ncbi:MAG: PAS domain-containing protein [Bacteroidales bacterium]
MSEFINNSENRITGLTDFARGLINGENGLKLVEKYKPLIDTVTDRETMLVLDNLLLEDIPFEKVKMNVGKIINIFYKSLKNHQWEKPGEGHFLFYLMLENREVEKIMHQLKSVVKLYFNTETIAKDSLVSELKDLITKLREYEIHYSKKENILFPYIEKTFPQYRCLQLMWSFHDDFRLITKSLLNLLEQETIDNNVLNKEIGRLFFVVLPIIFREEQIIFPVACKSIPAEKSADMLAQSQEIGWCYIQPPTSYKTVTDKTQQNMNGKINLGTGVLIPEQIILMLESLPVDITYVDDNDEVCYFSGAKHRIFSRTNEIIGRKVQDCHPRDSVYQVNKIIAAFRNKEKDHADFWIMVRNRFVHIRYFALYDDTGIYKGTIEVSQDITDIRSLKGERRLLDWTE